MMRQWPLGLVLLLLAGSATVGCVENRQTFLKRLREDNPRMQVEAIADVEHAGDRTMVGELIDLLASEDEGVRFMAASALHQLTGKNLGFQFAKDRGAREQIAAEWRSWWETEGRDAYGAPAEAATPTTDSPVAEPSKEGRP